MRIFEQDDIEYAFSILDTVGNWRLRQTLSSKAQTLGEGFEALSMLFDRREHDHAADHLLAMYDDAKEFVEVVEKAFPKLLQKQETEEAK